MIKYDSRNWWGSIIHFYTSAVIRRLLTFTLLMGVFTTIITVLHDLDYIGENSHLVQGYSMMGIVVSILLGFRTNTAYDRWWEGRKQWGALVNHSRSLANMLNAMLPGEDVRHRQFFANQIANFAISLKEHLREGTKYEELKELHPKQLERYQKSTNTPNLIASDMFTVLENLYRNGRLRDMDILNLKPQVHALVDVLGACERIKKTPIPFSYSFYIKLLILTYTVLLPFGVGDALGYYTIPLVMFAFFAFVGVELLAEEIEDPFGMDPYDLPTGSIADTITRNVYDVLHYGHVEMKEEVGMYEVVH